MVNNMPVVLLSWWVVDFRRPRVLKSTGEPIPTVPLLSWKFAAVGIGTILLVAFGSASLAVGTSWLLGWIVYLIAFR